ncbi:MAG: aldo/keto reductase [Gordonia sp. (in: high G+C Gram-positive bacteria)]
MSITDLRRLGTDGPTVAPIGLGFMSFLSSTDDAEETTARSLVDRAIDLGVTLFDTADVYGPEVSEILLGKALRGRRDKVVLATKFGNALDRVTNPNARPIDGRPEYVRSAIEGSLRRLAVDHIDIYYQHRVDPTVPIEDTVGALKELVEAGKVRYLGLSEPGPETLRRAHAVHPITAVQNEWSVFTRDLEADTVPVARELGIGIVPYSPLGRGWLTGVIRRPEDVGTRRSRYPRFAPDVFDVNQALAHEVSTLAEESGITAGRLALAWVLARGDDVVPIPGTRHVQYLADNVAAADIALPVEVLTRLDAVASRVAGSRSIHPEYLGVEAPAAAGAHQ